MSKHSIKTVIQSSRPAFLILTPACIFLAFALSYSTNNAISYWNLTFCLLAALLAHISVNTFNEYQDYKSGLDAVTERTPFSGGSGALLAQPNALNSVLITAITTLTLTLVIGTYLSYQYGIALIPIGLLGIIIVLTYTPWINRRPWICLIAPGLAFGPIMIIGTSLVLTEQLSVETAYLSLVPFFLVNNLLLLNQLPDIKADMTVGRNHFFIRYGKEQGFLIYGIFVCTAAFVIISAVLARLIPVSAYTAIVPLLAGIVALFGAQKNTLSQAKLKPYLALNVVAAVVTPIALGLSIILGK